MFFISPILNIIWVSFKCLFIIIAITITVIIALTICFYIVGKWSAYFIMKLARALQRPVLYILLLIPILIIDIFGIYIIWKTLIFIL